MSEDLFQEDALAVGDEIFGEGQTRSLLEYLQSIDEEWAETYRDFVLGMYGRDVLSTAVRELCAVAALAALGKTPQLEAHLRAALRHNAVEEVREVLLQVSVYAGVPATMNAVGLLNDVLEERGEVS